jgi:chemotaxis signal transduction protein
MPDLVLVEAGGRRWAVPAARVREVAAVSTVTPIPTAPPPVVGLTQLRGQIVPVLDLAALPAAGGEKVSKHLLTYPDETRLPRPQDPLLVVELGPARAALWVERVLGVQPPGEDVEVVEIGALFDQLRQRVTP